MNFAALMFAYRQSVHNQHFWSSLLTHTDSNCDAKAECGNCGIEGQNTCPLNVCCSQFGFCGSTSGSFWFLLLIIILAYRYTNLSAEFCDAGCQDGYESCGAVSRPSCAGGVSTAGRRVAYYESWYRIQSTLSSHRKCSKRRPTGQLSEIVTMPLLRISILQESHISTLVRA